MYKFFFTALIIIIILIGCKQKSAHESGNELLADKTQIHHSEAETFNLLLDRSRLEKKKIGRAHV